MKRNLIFTLPILLGASLASGQVALRTSDLIKVGMSESAQYSDAGMKKAARNNRGDYYMIVRYSDVSALEEIERNGGEIVNSVGTHTAIITSPYGSLEKIAGSRGVTGAMLSYPVKRANSEALPASFVDKVKNGEDLPAAFDGKGVIIALFDVGIDPNHINFCDENGNSRVKMLWNYPGATAKPDIYNTKAKIAAYTSDSSSESHGTHVLGIMAGSFVDSSNADAPDYRGVATGADIVVASGVGYNAQILDALERVGAYAQAEGKPCVVNLSFGDNVGPHDGSDEFTEAINDIAAKYNLAICMAGGNEGSESIALVKTLSEEDPELKTLLVKSDTEVGGNFQVYGPLEIWTNDATPFEVTLDVISRTAPDSPLYTFVVPEKKETYVVQGTTINQYIPNVGKMTLIDEGTEFQNMYVNSFMGGVAGKDSYNGRYCAKLNFYIEGRTSAIVSRNFIRVSVKGNPGQKIYMYTDGYYMALGNKNIPDLDVPDGYGTNSNMACGENTFAVGSYVSANVSGSGYPTGTIGNLSYFSSYGETLDGRIMPDACAPGQVIISSRNSSMPTSSSFVVYYPLTYSYTDSKKKKTYYWTSCAGTSQASPHVAGIMALMRGANPELSAKEIYEIVRNTAEMPEYGDYKWGHGKVNAYEAVKAVLSGSGVIDVSAPASEAVFIDRAGDGYSIFASGEDSFMVELYNMNGMCISRTQSDSSQVTVGTAGLQPGIYLLNVKGNSIEKTVKIII